MINSFETEVAKDVGINAAVIYKNIQYWCEKNRTNEQNEFDGLYWTYNSISAFEAQFPYLSGKQIRTALNVLEEKGYIKSGNYNKSPYDRTKWYADLRVDSACPIEEFDLPSRANVIASQGEPIPNNNPNNNQIETKRENRKRESNDLLAVMDSVEIIRENPELRQAFIDYIAMRKQIKKPLTDRALKLNINDAYKLAGGNAETMRAIVDQSIKHSWAGMYALKQDTQQITQKKQESKAEFWARAMNEAKAFDEQEARNAEANIGYLLEDSVGLLS